MAELYCLTSPSGKQYIGIAKNAKLRWGNHKSYANSGTDTYLYRAMRHHGFNSFEKKVLVIGEFDYVKYLEPLAIRSFCTKSPFGYNLTDGGDGTTGYKHTEQHKKEQSIRTAKRMESPEAREILRQANIGRKQSAEINKKKGRPGFAPMLGKKHSEAARAKISKALIGNTHTKKVKISEERKRHLSVVQMGRYVSPEAREKIRLARLGSKATTEARNNMSIAAKAREAKRIAEGRPHPRKRSIK